MYSFRFIRSCISWTQYTWVYILYVRVYMYLGYLGPSVYDPRHDKTNNMAVRPAKTQISLSIRPVWSESSLSAWRSIRSLATHWAHSEDSDQTGRMPRLIWVFAGRTLILLVLSCRGSYVHIKPPPPPEANDIWKYQIKWNHFHHMGPEFFFSLSLRPNYFLVPLLSHFIFFFLHIKNQTIKKKKKKKKQPRTPPPHRR